MNSKVPSTSASSETEAAELELRHQDAWAQRQRAERLFQGAEWPDEQDDELDD